MDSQWCWLLEVGLAVAVMGHLVLLYLQRLRQRQQLAQMTLDEQKLAYLLHTTEAEADLQDLDLTHLQLAQIQPHPRLTAVRTLRVQLTPNLAIHPDALEQLANVGMVVAEGAHLTAALFAQLETLPKLHTLDLSRARAVVEHDNSVAGYYTARDLYELMLKRDNLTLLLPSHARVPIGEVVKVFPKAGVAVLGLYDALKIGDVILQQRANQTFEGAIRTDDHEQLQVATPLPDVPITDVRNQVAVKMSELGTKGDQLMWTGHVQMRSLKLRPKPASN
ncbi:uncharacterized protein MONBRDRAFT_30719 [Monosiga brevicollis MX1]|uniref:Uncharacterized protein n=1 Tax=Monosiga brevicollis TaxID=81824 RepID=A9UNS5_MONBE|nr:uncharacterized protein MONBRDRAFT_30719 [Monosiga brevicollis MX1]EDQ92296.1 predicted protein [Monosiga brevicollis MX1]|eukprot:XP_001742058.1 hypothetical protein [Monosiga brevicollis MX1]